MDYAAVRALHIGCAVLSITLFLARAGLQLAGVDWRRWRWLRVLPHANDTVLLGAAIALAVGSGQYPLQQHWLSAKVAALVVYVLSGAVALRPQTPPRRRLLALAVALASVGWIVWAARSRSALPFLG